MHCIIWMKGQENTTTEGDRDDKNDGYIDPDEAYEVSGWIVEHMDKNICRAEINQQGPWW